MMNRTGQQGDAVPTHLVAKVLASHADPGGAGKRLVEDDHLSCAQKQRPADRHHTFGSN
jgi:hypothetical protein